MEIDVPPPSYQNLNRMEMGSLNFTASYSMYFDYQEEYLPIGEWMKIQEYIDDCGGEMRSQKRFGSVNGVLDIVLKQRINSKINDLF